MWGRRDRDTEITYDDDDEDKSGRADQHQISYVPRVVKSERQPHDLIINGGLGGWMGLWFTYLLARVWTEE